MCLGVCMVVNGEMAFTLSSLGNCLCLLGVLLHAASATGHGACSVQDCGLPQPLSSVSSGSSWL